MEPNALILSWWSYSTPLWYVQRVEGRRPDIAIVDDRTRLDENLGGLTDVIDANLGDGPSTSSGSIGARSPCWRSAMSSTSSAAWTRAP